jgi:hypothetical protein
MLGMDMGMGKGMEVRGLFMGSRGVIEQVYVEVWDLMGLGRI